MRFLVTDLRLSPSYGSTTAHFAHNFFLVRRSQAKCRIPYGGMLGSFATIFALLVAFF